MKKIIILIITHFIACLNNGLGRTPQMGWNSWNIFQCNIDEKIIKDTIDAIVDRGLLKAGYKYIILDDCWQKSRDENGIIAPDPEAFPNGIKSLADYAHSKGLLFGLCTSAGKATCQGRPGSLGYEEIDAKTFADWGIDYLKIVFCNCNNDNPEKQFSVMRDALLKVNKSIFLSINEWGGNIPAKWAKGVANSWRTTSDNIDNWANMIQIIDSNNQWVEYAGPGGWNDPDMLQVGNNGMSYEEYKSHFALWSISKAPLIIGCNITNMKDDIFEILSNEEIIAVNQDPLGIQGKKIKTTQPTPNYEGYFTDDTDVIISECNGSTKQIWEIKEDGSIRHLNGELCLEIPLCTRRTAQVQTSPCHIGGIPYCQNSRNQLWSFNDDGTITSRMDEKCLDIFDSSTSVVQTNRCEKSKNKKWEYDIKNKAIKINGKCLTRTSTNDSLEVWASKLVDNSYAVLLLNRGQRKAKMTIKWSELGLSCSYALVRDLWRKKDLGEFKDVFGTVVGPHYNYFLKIKPVNFYSSKASFLYIIVFSFVSLVLFLLLIYLFRKIGNYLRKPKYYININEFTESQTLK